MAVTIFERPKGHILSTGTDATIIAHSAVAAVFLVNHGILTGTFIYVSSNIENYNGFRIAESVNASEFRLRNIYNTEYITYIQDSPCVIFISTFNHNWSAVHLPITYRISNDLYPTNSVDTARTITSLANYQGFAQLGLSGSLGTFEDLSFVKISGASDSDIDGVYQVIDKLSTSSVILNIDYSTINGAGILGATIQLYYGNYNVVVRVYAGINSSHEWAAQKPYELATTLRLIPDDDNQVFFSINDILKSYVSLENNTTLGTLPNNIDAWTNFYISIAESYDTSNGYTISTNETSFTSDQSTFEGTAVNAKLAFKNIHSGSMSDYLMTNNAAKFLTLFTIPVLFQCGDDTPDCYSDISFILPKQTIAIASYFEQEYYSDGVLISTVNDVVDDDEGVIRMPLDANCSYDRVDVTVIGGVQLLSEPEFNATGDWLQTSTAAQDWVISGGQASVVIGPTTSSELLYQSISGDAGTYRIKVNVNTSNKTGNDWQVDFYVGFSTGGIGGAGVLSKLIGTLSGTDIADVPTLSYDAIVTVPGSFDTIFTVAEGYAGPTSTITVNLEDLLVASAHDEISETKQFDIDCGCADQELRLTWLNNLGGFDYWSFTGQTGHAIDITEARETIKNIFPNWPNSYGAFADTIKQQTSRVSIIKQFVFSQNVTQDQADAIAHIKSSPLVQIVNSRTDKRTVIVDTDSFVKYTDGDKLYQISFNILYTDDIPAQTV